MQYTRIKQQLLVNMQSIDLVCITIIGCVVSNGDDYIDFRNLYSNQHDFNKQPRYITRLLYCR